MGSCRTTDYNHLLNPLPLWWPLSSEHSTIATIIIYQEQQSARQMKAKGRIITAHITSTKGK